MSLLVCDFGHSRFKVHLYSEHLTQRWILPLKPFSWPEQIDPSSVREMLFVGTHQAHRLRVDSHCSQRGFPAGIQLGVDCKVPLLLAEGIHGVGNDRLAQALGAEQEKPQARNLIVSAGSALVIDLVQQGQFQGGMIGLGWKIYGETMAKINPLLVTQEQELLKYPGKKTSEAVALGWQECARGAIERNALGCDHVFFTGGDSQQFSSVFPKGLFRPWLGVDAMAKALGYRVNESQVIHDQLEGPT